MTTTLQSDNPDLTEKGTTVLQSKIGGLAVLGVLFGEAVISGAPTRSIQLPSAVEAVALSETMGFVAVAMYDGRVGIWADDLSQRCLVGMWSEQGSFIAMRQAQFARQDTLLFCVGPPYAAGDLGVWEAMSGHRVLRIAKRSARSPVHIIEATIAPEGDKLALLVGRYSGESLQYELRLVTTGDPTTPVQSLVVPVDNGMRFNRIAFHPSGRWVLTLGTNPAKRECNAVTWRLADGGVESGTYSLASHGPAGEIVFAPDGSRFGSVLVGSGVVTIWNWKSLALMQQVRGGCAFSFCGNKEEILVERQERVGLTQLGDYVAVVSLATGTETNRIITGVTDVTSLDADGTRYAIGGASRRLVETQEPQKVTGVVEVIDKGPGRN